MIGMRKYEGAEKILNLAGKNVALLFALLVVSYFGMFISITNVKDSAYFGGDTWGYQSMGVNFARGHGINKFGGLELFETYKFEVRVPFIPYLGCDLNCYYKKFVVEAGKDNFYRTPAYPLFLGVVYKTFGVSPMIAKVLQLLMLVIIAATLPFIGNTYWGRSGFIGGLFAGPLYLISNYKLAEAILTESLVSFAVFLALVTYIAYERRPKLLMAIMLGLSLGFSLLVKGSLIFIPILTLGLMLFRIIISKGRSEIACLIVAASVMLATVLPWSVYATIKSGRLIALSTQGGAVALDDNNELCKDGKWHPEWRIDKNSFYNTDGISEKYATKKVINFYYKNPTLLPRILFRKVLEGFGPILYLWIFMMFLLSDIFQSLVCRRLKSHNMKFALLSAILVLNVSVLVFIPIFSRNNINWTQVITMPSSLKLVTLTVIFSFICYICYLNLINKANTLKIPLIFALITGNFLLITIFAHGDNRYISPMNFIFTLLCCVSGMRLLTNLRKNIGIYDN